MKELFFEPAITPSNLDGTFKTFTGKKFDFNNPSSSMIDIIDIAYGLSNQAHFNGQTPHFFSIAQHSIMVYLEYCEENPLAPVGMKLMALLHDASEAYTGDVIKPLKIFLPNFVSLENSIMQVIATKFGLPIHRKAEIKSYDLYIQNVEYNAFYRGAEIHFMTPETARELFLSTFNELRDETKAQ